MSQDWFQLTPDFIFSSHIVFWITLMHNIKKTRFTKQKLSLEFWPDYFHRFFKFWPMRKLILVNCQFLPMFPLKYFIFIRNKIKINLRMTKSLVLGKVFTVTLQICECVWCQYFRIEFLSQSQFDFWLDLYFFHGFLSILCLVLIILIKRDKLRWEAQIYLVNTCKYS